MQLGFPVRNPVSGPVPGSLTVRVAIAPAAIFGTAGTTSIVLGPLAG